MNSIEEYERDYAEMFETNGWTRMTQEADEEVESLKEQLICNEVDIQVVYFIKGRIAQLRLLSNLELQFNPPDEGEVYDADLRV